MTETQVELKIETQEFITELVDNSYAEDDIYEFIEEYGEDNFVKYYEDYVTVGESNDYDAVDAFIEEFGIHSFSVEAFDDAYRGYWESKADYAENYASDCYAVDLPDFVEIDWEASFDNLDEVFINGYVFNSQF